MSYTCYMMDGQLGCLQLFTPAFQCIVPYLKTYNLELIYGRSHASRGSKLHQVFLLDLD